MRRAMSLHTNGAFNAETMEKLFLFLQIAAERNKWKRIQGPDGVWGVICGDRDDTVVFQTGCGNPETGEQKMVFEILQTDGSHSLKYFDDVHEEERRWFEQEADIYLFCAYLARLLIESGIPMIPGVCLEAKQDQGTAKVDADTINRQLIAWKERVGSRNTRAS